MAAKTAAKADTTPKPDAKAATTTNEPNPAAPKPADEIATAAAPAAAQPVAATTISEVPAPISNSRFKALERQISREEHANTHWRHTVSPLVPYARILEPDYWANVVGPLNFKMGDFITVDCADNSWVALLYIFDVGSLWAKPAEIWKKDLSPLVSAGDGDSTSGFALGWDRLQGHFFYRESDKAVLGKGFKTKVEAHGEMLAYAARVKR